jgi:hypothetical protein
MDLRLPSGLLFTTLGIILLGMGVFGDYRAPLTEVNVNLYCGVVFTLFGGILLLLARKRA